MSWTSRLQKCIALSTTELEYVVTIEDCKEALWLSQLVGDLGSIKDVPLLHCDSQSAIHLAGNPVFMQRQSTLMLSIILSEKCLRTS